jgi:hypothetical protein
MAVITPAMPFLVLFRFAEKEVVRTTGKMPMDAFYSRMCEGKGKKTTKP